MAQAFTINNWFPILDLKGYEAAIAAIQQKGAEISEEGGVVTYKTRAGVYVFTPFANDGHMGVNITLDGEDLTNLPIPRILYAEERIQNILSMEEIYGERADRLREAQLEGYSNFYQQFDPLTWLETAAKIREFGDIEAGETVTIRTAGDGSDVGVYTLTKITRDDKVGIEVILDGAPKFNYPQPILRTAEQIVSGILNLRRKFAFGNQFQHNPENAKPLVATVRDGQNEIRLFSNGTITITGPGVMKVVTMADTDASKATELMEKILDLTTNQ